MGDDRYRSTTDDLCNSIIRAEAERDQARAEVERLREWLERIARVDTLYMAHEWTRQALAENEKQARAPAALARIRSVPRETIAPRVLDSPDDEPSNRTRTVDHGTSAAGARAVSFRAGSQKHRLLSVYAAAGQSGLTDEEAAGDAGLPSSACWWKRCSELRDVGAIEPTGETRDGAAGVPRIVCSITTQGWDLLWDADPADDLGARSLSAAAARIRAALSDPEGNTDD